MAVLGGPLAQRLKVGLLLLQRSDAQGIAARRLLVAGLGKLDELTRPRLEKALTAAARRWHVSVAGTPGSSSTAIPFVHTAMSRSPFGSANV